MIKQEKKKQENMHVSVKFSIIINKPKGGLPSHVRIVEFFILRLYQLSLPDIRMVSVFMYVHLGAHHFKKTAVAHMS